MLERNIWRLVRLGTGDSSWIYIWFMDTFSGEHRLDIWDGYDMVNIAKKKTTYQLVTGDRFLCQQNLDTYLDEYPEIKLKLRFLKDSQDVWGNFGAPQPTKPTYQLPTKRIKPMGLVSWSPGALELSLPKRHSASVLIGWTGCFFRGRGNWGTLRIPRDDFLEP